MGKVLTAGQVQQYERDGFLFPLPALGREEALGYRRRLEDSERRNGGPLKGNMRHKVHLLFPWAHEIVTHPKILDAVEDVLGPDIICWRPTSSPRRRTTRPSCRSTRTRPTGACSRTT
jgi:non-heme Fe2+,alpha-ketoglutarate-dependent halogenase